jgi:flagellar basal-body rod protein FlgB
MDLINTDKITSLLSSFLDVQSRRSEIVSGNLANVDTPGYVAKELEFGDYLKRAAKDAVSTEDDKQKLMPFMDAPRLVERNLQLPGMDGNTVDMDHEMQTMAEAGMQFLTGTQMLQSRLKTIRAAIREGR